VSLSHINKFFTDKRNKPTKFNDLFITTILPSTISTMHEGRQTLTREKRLMKRLAFFRRMLKAWTHMSIKCWNRSLWRSPSFITYAMSEVNTNFTRSLKHCYLLIYFVIFCFFMVNNYKVMHKKCLSILDHENPWH